MLDTSTPKGAHINERLNEATIIWMTTVTAAGQPQTAPVWYLWSNGEFLVYSLNSARVRNLAANPRVSVHLNDRGRGDDVVIVYGHARIDPGAPPGSEIPSYRTRYDQAITNYGWTWDYFDGQYKVAIRITPERFLNW